MIKLQIKSLVISIDKFKSVDKKWGFILLLLAVSSVGYLVTGSPFSVKIPVSVPITVSSQTSPMPPGSEPSSTSTDVKVNQPNHEGRTAFTAKGVKHANISNNIVEGFDRVAEVENIGELNMSGNQALARSKSSP